MRYMSSKEAAVIWGVSLREVQRLLTESRIPGAVKHGHYWLIPGGSEKPTDPRTARNNGTARFAPIPVLHLPKGNADAALDAFSGNALRLAQADLAYWRGDPEPAKAYWRAVNHTNATLLSAASLAAVAAISSGDYELYYEVEHKLAKLGRLTSDPATAALLSLPGVLASVSLALPEMAPLWLRDCDLSLFAPEDRSYALILAAMHKRNIGDHAAQLSIARTTALLIESRTTFTWQDVSLWLLAASACFAMGDMEPARRYLLTAMQLGLPCGFLMPFADNLGDFGGMMEELLAEHYPDCREPILRLWERSFKNWMRFHNEFSRANITTVLTSQEYHAAKLLASGETYAGVSRRMSLSVGRVKSLQTAIYAKLHITRRDELRGYII